MTEDGAAKKRPAMRDGLVKRGNTWSYIVRVTDPATGKKSNKWVSGGWTRREDAKRARDKARNDVQRGTWVPQTDMTVGAYLDGWVKTQEGHLKPSTAASYRSKIDNYLKPALGGLRLQALSPSMLTRVFSEMAASGGKDGAPLSPRSVEFIRAVLRKALADAVVDRVIEVNPAVGSKAPRKDGKPKHITWTGEQQRQFLTAVKDTRWHPLWMLALATGMRRGELAALRWADVDLPKGVVRVEHSVTYVDGVRQQTTPKNHDRRRVQIDPKTVGVLKAWRKRTAAERLALGADYADTDGLVFVWDDGRECLPDYMSKEFVDVQAGLGLPRMTLHGTRHSHATTLLREGVPVHIVAKRLGHRDPSVTLNVYADAIPDDDTRATDVFARAVWG